LANQSRSGRGRREDRAKREDLADKILDAAAELITRWGYSKTTIDDIARQAGVSRGTIYLRWKTRDELFWVLLTRENLSLAEEVRQQLTADPEGITLHGLMKYSTLAALKSPLAKAMLLIDHTMLGELARKDNQNTLFAERMTFWQSFLGTLRTKGVIRADLEIQQHFYMLSAITGGFLLIDQWMKSSGLVYADEEIANMVAETIQRTLEPADREPGGTDVSLDALARPFASFMDKAVETLKDEKDKKGEDRS
jgi:AcrR family transcriptional regulator